MRMTIGKKLTFSFLWLAILVLLSGTIGIFILDKASKSADTVAKEKAPIQYAVMNAALAVEKVQKYMVQFIAAETDLAPLKKSISTHLNEFDMWISMVRYGTASEEFRNSAQGEMYRSRNLKVTTPKGSDEMVAIIGDISEVGNTLRKTVNELTLAHEQMVAYSITTANGDIYHLPEFINLVQRLQVEWVQSFKDAVNIDGQFTGETDPAKGLLGTWLNSYKVDNQEFMVLVEKMAKQVSKLRGIALKANEQSTHKGKQRMFNRGISATARIEKYFKQMHLLAGAIYQDLTTRQQDKENSVYKGAELINNQLQNLIARAEQEVLNALLEAETAKNRGTSLLITLTIAAVIMAAILGLYISRYLAKGINKLATATKKIAAGDLTDTVDISSRDELGELAGDTNTMITNLRSMIGQMHAFSGNLSSAAGSLADISNDLDDNAGDLGDKSTQATEATSNMNASMHNIATVAGDSMDRVRNVSMATEEMSSTINEIANNAEQAREVTSKAVVTADNTTRKMSELSDAAHEIGKVAEVIVEIAEQTNLLSLNATIEAARAGEAGKGFAVVANEVKELASQTNQATEDIRRKIEAIQESSEMTISEIREIASIINDINAIVVVIAGAVEEQAVTTNQIADDINTVSTGIEEMNQNVDSATEISSTVAEDINVVNETSRNVQEGSSLIKNNVTELEKLAGGLQEIVGNFKL